MTKWLIKANAETPDGRGLRAREFIVYAEDRGQALDLFEASGLGKASSVEPAAEVATNLQDWRPTS